MASYSSRMWKALKVKFPWALLSELVCIDPAVRSIFPGQRAPLVTLNVNLLVHFGWEEKGLSVGRM